MLIKQENKARIRTVCVEDAEAILQIHREVISEHDYFIALPNEFNKTIEDHQKWIRTILKHERETMLVAEYKNNVVGWIVFHSQERMRMHHIGSFAIMLKKECRNKGIGKLMIQKLLTWAEKHPVIEKVTLGTFSTNTRAIELNRKLGFEEEGRKVKEFKFANDQYVDDVLMYKWTK